VGKFKGTHLLVQPQNCDGYENCDFGVYLDVTVTQPMTTTAIFLRGTGTRKTLPITSHVPSNILFIPDAPPAGAKLDAFKLYRESHPLRAKPEDMIKQVEVGFGPPKPNTSIPVQLTLTTNGNNQIVSVDLSKVKGPEKTVKARGKK
jgi:hypothetical protein